MRLGEEQHSETSIQYDVVIAGHVGIEQVETPMGRGIGPGGAALYCAVGAALARARVGLVSFVGHRFPRERLVSYGIDVLGVRSINGPSTKFDITYKPTFRDRVVRVRSGPSREITVEDFPQAYFSSKYIHVATNRPIQQLEVIRSIRKLTAARLTVDCFDEFVRTDPAIVCDCITEADMFFANQDEAILLLDCPEFLSKPRVLKLERLGALYLASSSQAVYSPAPKSNLIDPTGAGDVLAGYFLGSLAIGIHPQVALEQACDVAARSIASFSLFGLQPDSTFWSRYNEDQT